MLADVKHDLCEQLGIIDPAGGAVDFELWCTAVSAIHGCGACVDSHEKTLREKGVRKEPILAAVRIASVIHGLASVMEAEKASMPAAILV